jgi:hypothetical protein
MVNRCQSDQFLTRTIVAHTIAANHATEIVWILVIADDRSCSNRRFASATTTVSSRGRLRGGRRFGIRRLPTDSVYSGLGAGLTNRIRIGLSSWLNTAELRLLARGIATGLGIARAVPEAIVERWTATRAVTVARSGTMLLERGGVGPGDSAAPVIDNRRFL